MLKSFLPFTFLLLTALLFLRCYEEKSATAEIVIGEFEHQGLLREYIYYSSSDLNENSPLVVVLHGFTGDANKIMEYSGMNKLAKENGFAVVYPQGTKDEQSNTFWNVGYEFHADIQVDDVDFIVKLTNFIQKKYTLSTTHTFITGMSNGGEMCYLLACRYPDVFEAAAPVAATMMNSFFDHCDPSPPISLLAIFGTEDKTTDYYGDEQNEEGWGAYKAIPYIIDFWTKKLNGNIIQMDTLPDLVKEDSSFVVRQKYLNEDQKVEFIYYKIIGGGHDWPGVWGNEDIHASEVIWQFFEDHVK